MIHCVEFTQAANPFRDSRVNGEVLKVKDRDGEVVNMEPVVNTTATWTGGSMISL